MTAKRLLILAFIFSGALSVMFFATLLLPNKFKVVKTLKIDASTTELAAYTHNLTTWPKWTIWNAANDSTVKFNIEGEAVTIGQKLSWSGDIVGKGYFEVTDIEFETQLDYKMYLENIDMTYFGEIRFEELTPQQTKVFWVLEGEIPANPILRVAGLFAEEQYGGELAYSLNGLKGVVEE